jgi:PLP dependent protein
MNGRSNDQNSHNRAQALSEVEAKITMACLMAARPRASVCLLAVSKTFPAQDLLAFAKLGQKAFGENYLQEALDKQALCLSLEPSLAAQLEWHFIGPIQSNKTKPIAEHFDWVHSVDREKTARRLIEQRPGGLDPFNLCLQVNMSDEASKSGCKPADAQALALAIAGMIDQSHVKYPDRPLKLRGLMCIPEPAENELQQRKPFAATQALFGRVKQAIAAIFPEQAKQFDSLSMGMSADLQAAILEGSTLVRVGSALFGAREGPA